MAQKSGIPTWLIVLGVVSSTLTLCLVGGLFFVQYAIESSLADVTDLSTYPTHRQSLGASSVHFPETIPRSAQNAQILFVPGFLQGPTRLELRITLPRSDVQALILGLPRDKEVTTPLPESVRTQYCELLRSPGRPDVPQFNELVGQYRVFVVYDTGNQNHPNMGGVLIDPESGDVVYFAEH